MYQILLIEDAPDFQLLVVRSLGSKFTVVVAPTLSCAHTELVRKKFDLILIDVVLPDGNGFQFCSELHKNEQFNSVPLILLTGKTDLNDRVSGWTFGADDYIVKPFDPTEFQVRVESRITRTRSRLALGDYLQKGPIRLNLAYHEATLTVNGSDTPLNLTPNEFKILHSLMKNQDKVMTRAQLLQVAWGSSSFVTDRTVDKHISSLRKKLENHGAFVVTVPGMGYRFSIPRAA